MRKAAVVAASLLLGACASSPEWRPAPVELPAEFRERARAGAGGAEDGPRPAGAEPVRRPAAEAGVELEPAALTGAWRELGDTTLARLTDEALRANLDVAAAAARIGAARSARLDAALDLAPVVTFAGGYTRQRIAGATFPFDAGSFPDQDVFDGGLEGSWELDVFGRVRRSVQAQGALVEATRESLRDVQVSLLAELARAYFDLRGAEERLAVARRNAENQRRTLEVTREQLDAGRGTAFDTDRAEAQLGLTLSTIPGLEARVAAARYRIGVLVGRPPGDVAAELAAPGEIPPLPADVAVASPGTLVRRRPDVAAAERRVAAERALVGAARADYLPRLRLEASAGLAARSFDALGDDGSFRYGFGPVLSWAAFDLGRVKARVDGARAREEEAEARYAQAVLVAVQEVESALARYRAALDAVARIEEAAAAARRAADLARLLFVEGGADFLQVLDSERRQLEAEDRLAQGRTEAADAYASLYEALGGAWAPAGGRGEG